MKSKIWLVGAVIGAAALSACVGGIPCSDSSQCPEGGECSESLKICITKDAGAGGGSTGGGGATGGGATGGGTGGGGSTGGGAGGGTQVPDCEAGCQEWETCQPGDGGTCRAVTVQITAPSEGTVFAAGAGVRLVAKVKQWDGGDWEGAAVPVTVTGGATGPTTLTRDAGYAGDFALPDGGGHTEWTVGWAGGPTDSVRVDTQVCTVTCQFWEECVPSVSGGTCRDLELRLAWATPDSGAVVGPSATVNVRLSVSRVDGGAFVTPIPVKLMPEGSQTTLTSGANWATTVTVNAVGGSRTLTAGWDGGPGATTNFTVDTTPPTFNVSLPPTSSYGTNDATFLPNDPDGAAWRRDEVVSVEVWSDATDVDAATVQLAAQIETDAALTVSGHGTSCSATAPKPYCRAFAVDLSLLEMRRKSGQVRFTASGKDVFANAATAASATGRVTRWQWARQINTIAGSLKASPVVDKDGNVIVASATTGGLIQVTPNGVAMSLSSDGPVVASPAIGRDNAAKEYIFYMVDSAGGTLKAIGATQSCSPSGATSSPGSLAVLSDGTANVVGVGSQGAPTRTRLVGLIPTTSGCPQSADNLAAVGAPSNFIAAGTTVFWADASGTLRRASLSGLTFTPDGSQSLGGVGIANGLAVHSNGTAVAGGGGPGIGRLFSYETALTMGTTWPSIGTPVSAPVVTTGGMIAVIRGSNDKVTLIRVRLTDGATQASTGELNGTSFSGTQVPSPVAGAGTWVYVTDENGLLSVLPQDFANNTSPRWSAALPSALVGKTSASPTLTCNKRNPTSQTGVFYLATEAGWLVSYLVDSKGLDTQAPWPKYGHDARNTNNPSVAIEACP